MQQIIFRDRDGQQHIVQQQYPAQSAGAPSQQGGGQQQWHFTQVRQGGQGGGQQIVIQQQNQQHVLQQQQQQSQQQNQQQILLQQQFSQQGGGAGGGGQQIFIQQQTGGGGGQQHLNQQRTTNWTLVQQSGLLPQRGQVLKLNARAHQQLQNMTPQEKSNFFQRLSARQNMILMQGQRPGQGTIIARNMVPGQQIATVIQRHPTTGNWVHTSAGPQGQINPQQQIILQQQGPPGSQATVQGQPPGQGQQVRVQTGPQSHLIHKQQVVGGGGPGPGFGWNQAPAAAIQSPETVTGAPPPPGTVVQQTAASLDQQHLLQLKQRQLFKLQQQQQQAKAVSTPLYNQVMEQAQAGNQNLTNPDMVSGTELNDVSAAGQLRLMTAHHEALQRHTPHPVSATQLYQSAQSGNVLVTSNTLSQQQVTPPRVNPQMVTSSSRSQQGGYGSSGGHSAAQRVAAVLAKSAAGQSVSAQHQQQMAHQQRAQFYGHNPNIKLPPEQCLLGCVFLIVEYDKQPDEAHHVDIWRQIILQNGGEVESSYVLRLTHILCLSQKHPLVQQGLRDGKRCITAHWLNDVITRQHVLPPHLAIHFPTPYSDEKPCRNYNMSLSGFEKEERDRVRWMIEATGAKYCSYYNSRVDFLVARKLEGPKVKKAKELQRPIVNVQWLNEVMFGHYACIQQADNQKYQQFNLSHPFRIDYSLVLHLMGPWKAPINVSQEAYDKAKASAGLGQPRRKKLKISHPGDDTEDGENSELPPLPLDPLPYETKPKILLTGFSKPLLEEKKVKQLGADIAPSSRDATHLVLADPSQGRTLKFLCALSRVRYIVSGAWLRASMQASHLVDEAEYAVKEVVVSGPDPGLEVKTENDTQSVTEPHADSFSSNESKHRVVCNVPDVLSRGEARSRLFAGKFFYISPSVVPSPSSMRDMIESAGGTVERQRRSWSKIQEPASSSPEKLSYLVITCRADLHLMADLLKHDYGVYNTEFVMTSIMTQTIDYSFYTKRSHLNL
uniref:PAX-interacting protein 1 n=1 Tax=Cacopsylla melanoneura TaxID=428564 RepID=A0A8D8VF19_9HEMI